MKNILIYIKKNVAGIFTFFLLLTCLFLIVKHIHAPENVVQKKEVIRTYKVRLTNSIGSDWYDCDSIIDVSTNKILLKNREDTKPFIEIRIPANVIVRIYPHSNNNQYR